jgi:hypothetical protein
LLEARFGHEAGHESAVYFAHVAHRVPHVGGGNAEMKDFT